ncbi:hypothetical protein PV327_002547 [Microctonus hyperodae]|uniref:Nucleolar 27S pre-rRNA processing Urb2/Npa2 C-terminal domain-containing protein n=1 Tax=Microctonus hyperodae TaxID=165561 RepID=A0AA39KPD0_MICHY|nr:hypothetical protein PV327_002547 [Microctonus hyperodae]
MPQNTPNSVSDSTSKMEISEDLFNKCNEQVIDMEIENDEVNPTVHYHGIIDKILALDHLDNNAYNSLGDIAKLNPLIIERKLQDIFKKILLTKRSTDIIKSSYVSLMSNILNACVRLRRENKLVSWILMALGESLRENEHYELDNLENILPSDFTNKFTTSINNMTNAVATEVLMSFIYHLDLCTTQSLESNILSTMLGVSSRLIAAFFNGIHIFDHSTPLVTQKKFVDGLIKFGNILNKLSKLLRSINKCETIAIALFSIIASWQKVIAFMKNYAPDSITEENDLLISQIIDNIHRRINKIDSNSIMNDTVARSLSCYRLEKNRIDNNMELDHTGVLDDIRKNWQILIDYPHLMASLDDSQLSVIASCILLNAYDSEAMIQPSIIALPIVKQNKKLIIALIAEIMVGIVSKIQNSASITSNLLTAIAAKNLLEDQGLKKILKVCKKLLVDPEWSQNEYSISIVGYLKVLLMLPLIYLSKELKIIIFLVVFSMTKEWVNSSDIIDLCYQILTDLSEENNIDILQYINIECFIGELSKHSVMNKVLKCSLCNTANYDSITTFIKCHKNIEDHVVASFLECIEKIKPKLKPDERITIRKIGKKLQKKILSSTEVDINNLHQVKILKISFKEAVASKKVDEVKLERVYSTLNNIFEINDKDNEHPKLGHNFHHDDAIMNEGLQIIKIILRYRDDKQKSKTIIKHTWSLMLTKSSDEIMPDLFEVTPPKVLNKVLSLLQMQTIDAHKQQNKSVLENCLKIWNCLSRANTTSHHFRQLYLQRIMRYFCIATLSSDDCLNMLKLCTITIQTKHVPITEQIIDLILLMASLRNFESISVLVADQILSLCLAFITYRINIIIDRLPMLLSLYRRIIRYIIDESKCKESSSTEHQLECLALNVKKLAIALIKLKKDMSKVSPYLIADLVHMYSDGVIPTYVKGPLDDCIGIFLSNCDQHAIPLLFRALPPATQEIFKTLYDTYNKFYKFTGKI